MNIATKPPTTLSEAIDRLQVILSPDEKQYIATMDENDLFGLHFSLGLEIRNAFVLHDADSKLLGACPRINILQYGLYRHIGILRSATVAVFYRLLLADSSVTETVT